MAVALDLYRSLAAPMLPAVFGSDSWLSALPREEIADFPSYFKHILKRAYDTPKYGTATRSKYGKRHKAQPGSDLGVGAYPSSRPVTKEGVTFHFAHTAALKNNDAAPLPPRSTRLTSPRAAVEHAEYIERREAVALLADGKPLVLTNIGTAAASNPDRLADPSRAARNERKEFWRDMEDITRKGGMVQHRLIVELPAPPGDNPSPETVQATVASYPKLLADFARTALEPHGLRYVIAVHHPDPDGDKRNWHAHFAFSNRPAARLASGAWDFMDKATRQKVPEATRLRTWIWSLRAAWAEALNRSMAAQGRDRRYTPKSYKELGVQKEPTCHLYPAAHALEKRGIATTDGVINGRIELQYAGRKAGVLSKVAALVDIAREEPVEWLAAIAEVGTENGDDLIKIYTDTIPKDEELGTIRGLFDTWFLSRPRRRRDWLAETLAGKHGILPTGKSHARLALEQEHTALTGAIVRAEISLIDIALEKLDARDDAVNALRAHAIALMDEVEEAIRADELANEAQHTTGAATAIGGADRPLLATQIPTPAAASARPPAAPAVPLPATPPAPPAAVSYPVPPRAAPAAHPMPQETRPQPPKAPPPLTETIVLQAFRSANSNVFGADFEKHRYGILTLCSNPQTRRWQVTAAGKEEASADDLAHRYAKTYCAAAKLKAEGQPEAHPSTGTYDEHATGLLLLEYLLEKKNITVPEPFRLVPEERTRLRDLFPLRRSVSTLDEQRKVDKMVEGIAALNPRDNVALSYFHQGSMQAGTVNADTWSERRQEYEKMILPRMVWSYAIATHFIRHPDKFAATDAEEMPGYLADLSLLYDTMTKRGVKVPADLYPPEEALRAASRAEVAFILKRETLAAEKAAQERIAESRAAAASVPTPAMPVAQPIAPTPAPASPTTPAIAQPSAPAPEEKQKPRKTAADLLREWNQDRGGGRRM